jgi:hypothetical protein
MQLFVALASYAPLPGLTAFQPFFLVFVPGAVKLTEAVSLVENQGMYEVMSVDIAITFVQSPNAR